jgi:hypothetical protein
MAAHLRGATPSSEDNMADNTQLDSFLATGTPPDGAQAPPQDPAPEPSPAPEKPPSTPEKPAGEAAVAEPEEDEEIELHSGSDSRLVPLASLEKVRNDWKSKAAAEKARADELNRQLEAIRRPVEQPPQQPQYQPIPLDPVNNPQGFIAQVQREMFNDRLNTSELMLRKEIGAEAVSQIVADFKQAAAQNPMLERQLQQQVHPYEWVRQQVEMIRLHRDVGDDPAAYRARIEAELRSKWEAEAQGNAPARVSPAAGLPPSLANARSVAGRTTSSFTGPPTMDAILAGAAGRRNGAAR